MVVGLAAGPALGYLKIHPSDPHYLQETTTGEAVVTTSHGNIVPNESNYDDEAGFRLTNQSWRMMYARSWHFCPWAGTNAIWPWAASATGGGYWGGNGGNKLDLNSWNATCWTRHKNSVNRADNADCYVQIMLFDRCGMSPGTDTRWGNNPWAANNNINNLEVPNANPPNDGTPDFYHYSYKPNLKNQQERYVRKMIDETITYDNVIYEVENEHWAHSDIGWCDYWCLFIKNYIGSNYANSPRLTSYSSLESDLDDAYYLGALDIVNKHYGNAAENDPSMINDYFESKWHHNKAINLNEFANGLTDTNVLREMCWTTLTSGGHFHVEDANDASRPFEVVDIIMRFKSYANWNFIGADPSDNLITSGGGYCLANPGVDYLCYFPSGGSKTVNLASGNYRSEFWDPSSGGFYSVSMFSHGGGGKSFSCPDGNDWALHITTADAKETVVSSYAAGTITIDGSTGDWSLNDFTDPVYGGDTGTGDYIKMGYHGYQDWTFYNGGHCTSTQFPPDDPDDTNTTVYSRNDSTYLYFLVRVDDDDIETSAGVSSNWQNDCVEFYIDPGNNGGTSTISNSTSDIQLVIDAGNQQNVYCTTSGYRTQVLGGISSAVSTDGSGYWMEVRITKSVLDPDIPSSGNIGVDINVRDNDDSTDSKTTIYTWHDPEMSAGFPTKIPDRWGELYLVDSGAAPSKATGPDPAHQATGVSITADLSWTAGGGATTHDVYFGMDSTPDAGEFQGNQAGTTYDPGTLSASTTYYWRIDEKNGNGTTTGDVWSFTTSALPDAATSPSPADAATDVSITADLSWTAGSGATSHDVYFGTDSTPDSSEFKQNQAGVTYDPGTLTAGITYYWRIDEKNATGTTTGTVWSFTTLALPGSANNPTPVNGATAVNINSDLSWTAGSGVTSHDVYFGTDSTPDAGEFKGNQAGVTYDPGTLSYSTTYYWRIDEKNASGITTGTVWSFTTAASGVSVSTLNVKEAGTITIDGDTSDWNLGNFTSKVRGGEIIQGDIALVGYDSSTLYYAGYWTGGALPTSASDHTAKVYSRHDSTYQYFLVRVDDDDLRVPNAADSNWANDCVEFYIDPSDNGGSTAMSDSTSDIQLVIDADNQENVYMCTSAYRTQVLNGVTSAVVTDSTGYWMEVRITKTALDADLPSSGTFGVEFAFRDNDDNHNPSVTTQYTWSDDASGVGFPTKIPDNWGNASLAALTQAPSKATDPYPAHQATSVSLTVDLSWTAGSGATSHDVYFGTDSTPDTGEFKGNQAGTTYDPGQLNTNTTYYWRIDEKNSNGTTTGDVWSFTTTTSSVSAATLNVKEAGTITIDGSTDDWALGEFSTKVRGGETVAGDIAIVGYDNGGLYYSGYYTSWTMPTDADDHTAKVYSRHDSTYQYFLLRIDDDDVETPNGTGTNWANDNVEFYIDPSDNGGSTAMSNSTSDIQLVIDAANQVNVFMTTSGYKTQVLAGVSSAVSTDGTGWWLEVRITKSVLDPDMPASSTFGVDFAFRDRDNDNSASDSTSYCWSDTEQSGGFPSKIPNRWGDGDCVALTNPPGQATNPSPADEATNISIEATLSWMAGGGATSHDVYFGTDSTPDAGEFIGNQAGTTYDPGTLTASTTYYWRIDEKNSNGTTTGDVWSFTTGAGVVNGVYANCGATQYEDGLYLDVSAGGDGETVADDIGGREGRKNKGGGDDYYWYLDVDATWCWQGSDPDQYITVSYYDDGGGSIYLQYDAIAQFDKMTEYVAFTNSDTWKTYTWHVNDAYFGDRLNGADVRVGITNKDRCIDVVKVTDGVPSTLGNGEADVDLGTTDIENGLALSTPSGGDGDTAAVTQSGVDCRKTNPAGGDYYMYFAVDNLYYYKGSEPAVYITIKYYDTGTSAIVLNYDSPGDEVGDKYKNGGNVTCGNTNTWKTHTYSVSDAYLAGRQNGNADFRIYCSSTMYLDTVKVSDSQ
jgi:hypothetical protein